MTTQAQTERLTRPVNNWCLITWADDRGRAVRQLACHFDELTEVFDLPWPPGAVSREPVTEYTGVPAHVKWFNRRPAPCVGEMFVEHINQADRECWVVAVDEKSGRYVYEYEMPNGRTYLRNQDGKPISRNRLPTKWRKLLDETET